MKKTKKIAILSLSALALSAVTPVFANTNVSTSGNATKYTDARKAAEAKKEAEAKAARLQPFVNAERLAKRDFDNATTAYNTVLARFTAANAEFEEAKKARDFAYVNVAANLKAKHDELAQNYKDAQARKAQLVEAMVPQATIDTLATTVAVAKGELADAQKVLDTHLLTPPVEGSAAEVVEVYNTTTKLYQNEVAKAQQALATAEAEHAKAAATRSDEVLREINEIDALKSDIAYKVTDEQITQSAEYRAANDRFNKAQAELNKVSKEMPEVRGNLDAARAKYETAIKDNKEAHYREKVNYTEPTLNDVRDVQSERLADAVRKAQQIEQNNPANGQKQANGQNTGATAGKKAATNVAAAKTPTAAKALPKTSAVK